MRVVDVSANDVFLSKARGFLRDAKSGGQTPLEGIDLIMVSAESGGIGIGLLRWAAVAGVPVVICDKKYTPAGMLLPIAGNVSHSTVLSAQIAVSEPRRKQFWASVVRSKIAIQADALALTGQDSAPVAKWLSSVRSGDPDNREATAAAAYFSRMFGPTFARRTESATNHHLDYAYAVVRGAMARATVGAGLHPALPLHHAGGVGNAFALVDDLMEPFRAVADVGVYRHDCGLFDLAPACKRALVDTLSQLVVCNSERMALLDAMRAVSQAWRSTLTGAIPTCPSITFDEAP